MCIYMQSEQQSIYMDVIGQLSSQLGLLLPRYRCVILSTNESKLGTGKDSASECDHRAGQ